MRKQYTCLFCNCAEISYQPECDFICSSCVQMLLNADQDDLHRAYQKAISRPYLNEEHRKACEPEYLRKAEAIKSFLIEEEIHEGKAKKSERNMVRARSMRAARPGRVPGR